MRHPFWRWAGWLSLGLAGCLHSFESRKVTAHKVSEQRTMSRPAVVGPFRKSVSGFVPQTEVPKTEVSKGVSNVRGGLAPSGVTVPQPASRAVTATKTLPTSVLPEECALPRGSEVVPAQFVPPPVPAAEPAEAPVTATKGVASSPARVATPASVEPRPFAEFDRAVPIGQSSQPSTFEPDVENADIEYFLPGNVERREPAELPVISPAEKPAAAPRQLPQSVTGLFQEPAKMTESAHNPATPTEAKVGPRDVAVLVELVFEDLRQHRLTAARERTEWLKRLVAKGASEASNHPALEETTEPFDPELEINPEPKRLDANRHALPVDKTTPELTSPTEPR